MTPFDLTGKLALVTGSRRGIGLAIARAYLAAGARVVLNSPDAGRLAPVAAELRALAPPETVLTSAFDVTDESAVEEAVAALTAEHGCPDILVNNAGIQLRGPLTDLPLADWKRVVDVDLTSAFIVGRTVARGMVARGSGKIINICSVQNHLVRPTTAPYAAAKSGLGGLTRSMCAEWARGGLQVNGLAPGYLDTDLNASLVDDPEFTAWITSRTPAGRWGRVEDVTGPAVWLASAASDFVNGQVVYVDGGLTAVI
ncbi:SDR family oxidoreductase [Umezawaea endophytica]|uniref:SDR family oxidoreductase n=1 Tax=Umezawaea endophytica TaxID=1654476 RepID=A0A9X2VFB9_9PSEU|nr:SDR family oxidoreductase [Umezawaea endophytica]MCS7475638.1 SDR family oxidoreductase [Umezawaea endophytica]